MNYSPQIENNERDPLLEEVENWRMFIDNRLNLLRQIYPENEIHVKLPSIDAHMNYIKTMNKSRQHIYTNVIGLLFWGNHDFRQTHPNSALYGAVMTQALAQAEGIELPNKVLDLGSGDGSIGIAFGLCGFEVCGIEIDEEIFYYLGENLESLYHDGVRFEKHVEFLREDYNDFLSSEDKRIWTNWPWPKEIDTMRSLFAQNAPKGSLLVSMCMSGNILNYVQEPELEMKQEYINKLSPLGRQLNWAQSSRPDFYLQKEKEWWGHVGGYAWDPDTLSDNWCILMKK